MNIWRRSVAVQEARLVFACFVVRMCAVALFLFLTLQQDLAVTRGRAAPKICSGRHSGDNGGLENLQGTRLSAVPCFFVGADQEAKKSPTAVCIPCKPLRRPLSPGWLLGADIGHNRNPRYCHRAVLGAPGCTYCECATLDGP
jgi:hypothetical protein